MGDCAHCGYTLGPLDESCPRCATRGPAPTPPARPPADVPGAPPADPDSASGQSERPLGSVLGYCEDIEHDDVVRDPAEIIVSDRAVYVLDAVHQTKQVHATMLGYGCLTAAVLAIPAAVVSLLVLHVGGYLLYAIVSVVAVLGMGGGYWCGGRVAWGRTSLDSRFRHARSSTRTTRVTLGEVAHGAITIEKLPGRTNRHAVYVGESLRAPVQLNRNAVVELLRLCRYATRQPDLSFPPHGGRPKRK